MLGDTWDQTVYGRSASISKSSEDLNQMKTQKNCALEFKVLKWATAASRLGMAELGDERAQRPGRCQ